MIKTIFFDVGSVILNEDWLHFKIFEVLLTLLRKYDAKWTFEALMAEREERILKFGDTHPEYSIAREYLNANDLRTFQYYIRYLGVTKRHFYLKPMPGIVYVIHNLSSYYQLGIIANQPAFITRYLKTQGILNYFSVWAMSEELNLHKPDPAIFQWALKHMRTRPEEAVMIGDRIDHDILPAKTLGMKAVLARFTLKAKGIMPQHIRERMYFQSLERVPNWRQEPQKPEEVPDAVVKAPTHILPTIKQLDSSLSEEKEPISLLEAFRNLFKEIAEIEVAEEDKLS